MRPLYSSLTNEKLTLGSGNAGLWYDKFCDQWSTSWTLSSDGDNKAPKLSWIETVANGKRVGDPGLLAESATRLHQLTEARRGIYGIFMTEGRFVTGLGRSHPVDNGFVWHPTLGVPYLPGSSVKGLVRAWATHDAEIRLSKADLDRLLGKADAPRSAGHVIFLDAIPTAAVRLEADVMTPHYAGWTSEAPPGDWREPKPVPFLAVAPETGFFFSLLPRGIEQAELEGVFHWLRDALRHAGAGAKTAVGYGRFVHDELQTKARSDELAKVRAAHAAATRRALLKDTAEGRWLDVFEGKSEEAILGLVRVHLEEQRISDPGERRGFARAVAATAYLELWRKGETRDKTIKTGRDKLKKRARLVDAAASETDPEPGR